MKKYYVDLNHPEKGIYDNWSVCEAEKKKGGTFFKGFATIEEANAAVRGEVPPPVIKADAIAEEPELPEVYAFTDGSFNSETGTYGYGGFLMYGEEEYILQGSGNDPVAAKSRNVSGEVLGAMAAVKKARELGIDKLTVFYDYEGIAKWALGQWKTNIDLTKEYAAYMKTCGIDLEFIHVKAHTGIPGNERADKLAKEAVGL